jgi:CRISPR-associated protein Csm1
MTNYFLKCDISGIQSFIFNVPSKGAAQALKSRSVYVQMIAEECSKKLKDFFGKGNATELYNGGGNFYLKISTDNSVADIQRFIEDNIYKDKVGQDIFAYVSFVKNNGEKTADLLNAVNLEISKAKIRRPLSYNLLDARPIKVDDVEIKSIKGINGQIPNGDFEWIANKSDGDSKLAALKLDVDNLGELFMERTEDDYKKLSNALKDFFDGKLLQLIDDLKMQQYIYVVFSGGDDCFLIGSWNKIFDLTIKLQHKFADFQRELKTRIVSLPKNEITFSAGIIVFQPHYPMLQLANEVEDALSASKRTVGKNSVTVFNKTLTWSEFEKAKNLQNTFTELINNSDERNSESKSLLQIFRTIYPIKNELPKVWRLKYYLRRNVKESNMESIKQIFGDYSQSLLQQHIRYSGIGKKNPDIYLVASRWAEILLKQREL